MAPIEKGGTGLQLHDCIATDDAARFAACGPRLK